MTDAELQGIAAQALNMAKKDFVAGGFSCLLGCYYQGEGFRRMRAIEALFIERLGENWLNSEGRKNAAFGVLKRAIEALSPHAFVFVSVANGFLPTEAMKRLSEEEQRGITNTGHDRHHQAVKEGLLTVRDIMSAVAQNPHRVCVYFQPVDGGEPPQVRIFDQRDFGGRLKMYGEETEATSAH